jgi:hypothetical protein
MYTTEGMKVMSRIIHARLDIETDRMLRQIERRLGWSDSKTIREGIRVLNGLLPQRRKKKIIGQGRFRSGIPDLGSNKDHMKGFGR